MRFVKALGRYAFLLLLAAALLIGDLVLTKINPVKDMTCVWRNDFELIQVANPDMTFDKVFYGSSAVTASYIEGRNDTGYANLGIDYGTVKDLYEMLEQGWVTINSDLVIGMNEIFFLDTLPTNETYPWHREWYEPYLYFHRDRLNRLLTLGLDSVMDGGPFFYADTSGQQRTVYRGTLSDEELQKSMDSMVERFGDVTLEDCRENFAALERLAAWCEERGVRLRGIWMPWNEKVEIYPAAQAIMDHAGQLLEELGVEVLDLTRAVPVQYFHDSGHLDYDTGAPWFTDLIDPWLAEEG